MNSPSAIFAVDFGSYRITFTVSPTPSGDTSAATAGPGAQLIVHCPPGGPQPPSGLAGAADWQAAHPHPTDQARPDRWTSGGETGGCPVCGALPDHPPAASETVRPLPRRLVLTEERTARVIAWMVANSDRPDVTVGEIAQVADLGARRLQGIIKGDFGRSPLQLLRDIGLHRVHLALTGRSPAPASLAEAAAQAGYTRVARFNAAYRERYGAKSALPGRVAAVMVRSTTVMLRHPGSPDEGDGRCS